MSTVTKSARGERDLRDIWWYIAQGDDAAADQLLDRLNAKLITIAGTPGIGTPRSELEAGLRSVALGRYVIFYRATDTGIELVRVVHGARDVAAVLKER